MRGPRLAAVLCALASPVFGGQAMLPALDPAPPVGPAAPVIKAPAPEAALVTDALWDRLPPLSQPEAAWLSGRVPGIDPSKIRRLSLDEVRPIIERCAAERLTGMDLFTDAGFRGSKVYYIPQDVMEWIDRRYIIGLLFPHQGKTVDGRDFVMQGTLLGLSKIDILYSLDDFTFKHPVYQDHGGHYTFKSRIHEEIEGPGRLRIQGVTGPRGVEIQGLIKTAPDRVRVVIGGWFDTEKPLLPITPR